jgi:uncharacterized membrane protein
MIDNVIFHPEISSCRRRRCIAWHGSGGRVFHACGPLGREAERHRRCHQDVVIADFIFTATAVVLQPITGSLLVLNVGY